MENTNYKIGDTIKFEYTTFGKTTIWTRTIKRIDTQEDGNIIYRATGISSGEENYMTISPEKIIKE